MDFSRLMSLAGGHAEARIMQAALRLGVFEALDSSPRTAEAVARELHLDRRATELLLNALTALEILEKEEAASFSLTPAGKKYLVRSSPQFVGAMIRFEDSLWRCWEALPETIRTGNPARPADMYQQDPHETEIFIDAMDSLVKARGDTEAVADALVWRSVEDLLDVGSGPATYPIALCRRFPHLRAVVFDLPETLKLTERRVAEAGLAQRISLVSGDYRNDPIPGIYDLIFLSNIIHGENEATNEVLIAKLAQNLKPAGRIVVKDHILDDSRTRPGVGAIFSMLMLLTTTGGRCYSFREVRRWMERAGLSHVHQIEFSSPLTSALVIGTR